MASTGNSEFGGIDFGGLCFNGHDVPQGARFCPQCGTPATAPSGRVPGPPAAAVAAPMPAPAWPPHGYGYGHRPGYGWPAPPPAWPAPGYGYGYGGPWVRRPLNAAAVVAAVVGLLWIYGLASLTAVILGHISLRQIGRSGERGRGLAVTGLVIGYLGLALTVVFFTLVAVRS